MLANVNLYSSAMKLLKLVYFIEHVFSEDTCKFLVRKREKERKDLFFLKNRCLCFFVQCYLISKFVLVVA